MGVTVHSLKTASRTGGILRDRTVGKGPVDTIALA